MNGFTSAVAQSNEQRQSQQQAATQVQSNAPNTNIQPRPAGIGMARRHAISSTLRAKFRTHRP